MNKTTKLITAAVILVIIAAISISFVTIIPSGHTGVITTFGKVSEEVLQEGLHIKMPWQVVHKINNRITKLDVTTEAFSKDLQTVSTVIAVEYRVDKSKSYSIFKEVGDFYESILVLPASNEVLKSIVSQYTAEETITNREMISKGLVVELNEKLNDIGITVEYVNIIDFDFSEAYISAIEEKQVAEQKLLKAKTEAEEKKVIEQGEADAMLIKAQAEADALIIKAESEAKANEVIANSIKEGLVDYKTVEKWDGKLPYATGSSSIIDFSGIQK